MIKLQKVLFKKIDSNFNLPDREMQLNIESSMNLNAMYSDDQKHAKGVLKSNLYAKGMESDFHVFIVMEGYFECEGNEEKLKSNEDIYRYMFPHLQVMVSDLFTKAGLPPITLEMSKMIPTDMVDIFHNGGSIPPS